MMRHQGLFPYKCEANVRSAQVAVRHVTGRAISSAVETESHLGPPLCPRNRQTSETSKNTKTKQKGGLDDEVVVVPKVVIQDVHPRPQTKDPSL